MNEETLQVLATLATKLGTTAEYLWGVLIKQAFIAGITDIMQLIILSIPTFAWLWFVWKNAKQNDNGLSEWGEEGKFFGYLSILALGVVYVIIFCCSISAILAAFLNPEYWAFKQIIH